MSSTTSPASSSTSSPSPSPSSEPAHPSTGTILAALLPVLLFTAALMGGFYYYLWRKGRPSKEGTAGGRARGRSIDTLPVYTQSAPPSHAQLELVRTSTPVLPEVPLEPLAIPDTPTPAYYPTSTPDPNADSSPACRPARGDSMRSSTSSRQTIDEMNELPYSREDGIIRTAYARNHLPTLEEERGRGFGWYMLAGAAASAPGGWGIAV